MLNTYTHTEAHSTQHTAYSTQNTEQQQTAHNTQAHNIDKLFTVNLTVRSSKNATAEARLVKQYPALGNEKR